MSFTVRGRYVVDIMKKIGIMGGTFDPIHFGHLVTAEAARDAFGLEKVVFVPAGHPPHKRHRTVSEARHRIAMVNHAIISNPGFSLSTIETEREGYSYTIDTVNEFLTIYGDNTELYFITGADAIIEILSWHRVEELIEKCRFIAAPRPGFPFNKDSQIPQEYRGRIFPFKVPALAISSSQIREMVSQGRSIRYLLPDTVEAYIRKNNLYRKENFHD